MLKPALLWLGAASAAFAMHYGELNINSKDIEAQLNLDMGQYNVELEPETVFVGFRYMNVDEEHGDFADSAELIEASYLMKRGIASMPELKIGFGFKADYLLDTGDATYLAIPLGVEAAYRLPVKGFIPLEAGVEFYYAPEVLSLKDAESYLEFRLSLDAEVIRNGRVTVGYRSIDTDFVGADANYNQSAYVGFKFLF